MLHSLALVFLMDLFYAPASRAQCTSPNGGPGALNYVVASQAYRVCVGTSWLDTIRTGSHGTCSSAGQMDYDENLDGFKFCDGANWRRMGCLHGHPTGCPNIGDVCSDGTVYAGLSPSGSVRMYTSRCDVGMTWNGSACTGTRSLLAWGSLGSTRGTSSTTNGLANTNTLLGVSAAQHPAAHACGNLNINGRDDWHMPAQQEMSVLWTNRVAIGGFSLVDTYPAGFYWNSTEVSANYGRHFNFYWGSQFDSWKAEAQNVRCVRIASQLCTNFGSCTQSGQMSFIAAQSRLAYFNGANWHTIGP